MNKSKCPVCGSSHTKKNGMRNGIQTYRCQECGYQFRNSRLPSDMEIWLQYQENKQTIAELSQQLNTSESTIKRHLRNICLEWQQPHLQGSGYVHLDVTYWGHNWGVMLALDDATGFPLYMEFIHSETTADYQNAVRSIEERGYRIDGLIIDGKQSLFSVFSKYNIQMCQFHMKQIIKRYLTKNPKLKAARALQDLMQNLTTMTKYEFETEYKHWKEEWKD